jgi:hypothetical protein
MQILNFQNFSNINLLIKESLGSEDSYLVGDSMSVLLASSKELKNKITIIKDLSEVGTGTEKFSKSLEKYRKTHPEVKFIFLSMGANDLYKVNSKIIASAKKVKDQLDRIFPNAQKFIVKAGSWGWGGLDIYGKKDTIPTEIIDYYNEVWKPLGFIEIPEYVKIQFNKKNKPVHPDLNAPGIKELVNKLLNVIEGKKDFYKEDIQSIRDLKTIGSDDSEILVNYYDVLQNAIHDDLVLRKQNEDSYEFDPTVERVQIGLIYLKYTLSQFGVDGLFGPETEDAVRKYKEDFEVGGDPILMDDYFFMSLINALKDQKLGASDIETILEDNYGNIENIEPEDNFSYSGDLGGDEYLIFVQHNQGVAGATSLVNTKYGKGKIHPFTRDKGMMNNIPSDMKEWRSQIQEALNSDNEQRAASLFLEMWKIKYASKKQTGMNLINKPQYSEVKSILERVSKESGIPFEVLVAIGTIESGLNPKSGNNTYKGLFALNPSTAVKYNPSINQGNVHDPIINADAAGKMLARGKNDLIQGLRRTGVINNLDLA